MPTYGAGSELPEAGKVWIWNAADGKLVRMFTVADKVEAAGPDYRVSAVALSRDNKRVRLPWPWCPRVGHFAPST